MADPIITNNDSSTLVIGSTGIAKYRSGVFTAAGAKTYPAGTILALDTATFKYIAYVKGGATNGNGVPIAFMGVEHITTGAGDTAVRPLVSATVNRNLVVIDADGDNSDVDEVVIAELRDYTLIVEDVTELAFFDNQ